MNKIRFSMIGSGWRSEFYMRIARMCPEQFEVLGVMARREEKRAEFGTRWGVKTFATAEELLDQTDPAFVVCSVTQKANAPFLKMLADRDMPALSETPPSPDLEELLELWAYCTKRKARIQVAEQYHLRPHHQAQMAVIRSGRLGRISQAQVSVAHDYHGISVMRRFLGIQCENALISAHEFQSPIVRGAGRQGFPEQESVVSAPQKFIRFDFGDRLGIHDFTMAQYFGLIRTERVLVRGERGEIVNDHAYLLDGFKTPIHLDFIRHAGGTYTDLGANCLLGFQFGEEWVYRNPFAPAPLTDEEIAIAESLVRMNEYVQTGREFYPLAEGCQDEYLTLMANRSIEEGRPVQTSSQPWASAWA